MTIGCQGREAATYRGFDGWWMRNGAAEAFVCAKPYPRVLAFRAIDDDKAPLFVAPDFGLIGIRGRVYVLDYEGDGDAGQAPALQPAAAEWHGPRQVTLTAAPERELSQLQLAMTITLHEEQPQLDIAYHLTPLDDRERRLALWPILAVPAEGVGILPYNRDAFARRLLHFPGLTIAQPAVTYGKQALLVDYAKPPAESWFKIGTDSHDGWVAWIVGDRVMRSWVTVDPAAEYPESGATVTAFKWRGGGWQEQPFGEIEHNGPIRAVGRDGFALHQRVELLTIPPPEAPGPDAWRTAIEAVPPLATEPE